MVSSDDRIKTIRSVMNIRDSNVLMPPLGVTGRPGVQTDRGDNTRTYVHPRMAQREELVRMCATPTMKGQNRNWPGQRSG